MPYSYSHFYALYKEWEENYQDIRLRFEYKGGEKYFDMESNCEKEAYLFVGVLGASNYMLREKLEELNNRAFCKMSGSRASVFEEVEKGNLKSLPCCGFDFGKWQKAKVHNDYHIQVENHYYSVPYRYIGKTVDVRISGDTVEIYFEGERISLHKRSYQKGKATTERSHRPPKHNGYLERTVELMKERGYQIGGYCGRVIEKILSEMPHPEMGFRSCEGIFRLGKLYGKERTEKACCKAYSIGISNYRTIRNILENGMEEEDDALTIVRSGMHGNIRGKKYYAQAGGIR